MRQIDKISRLLWKIMKRIISDTNQESQECRSPWIAAISFPEEAAHIIPGCAPAFLHLGQTCSKKAPHLRSMLYDLHYFRWYYIIDGSRWSYCSSNIIPVPGSRSCHSRLRAGVPGHSVLVWFDVSNKYRPFPTASRFFHCTFWGPILCHRFWSPIFYGG